MTATMEAPAPTLSSAPRTIPPAGPLMKFRLLPNLDGRAVGPHVDFARDDKGNILCNRSGRDSAGVEVPGDPVERIYYPGDIVLSEVDLCARGQDMNSEGQGNWKRKFERVYEDDLDRTNTPAVMTVEEAKRFLESQGARVDLQPSPDSGLAKNAELTTAPIAVFTPTKQPTGTRLTAESLDRMAYKDLLDLAKREKVDLRGKVKKEEIIPIILQAVGGV